MRILGVNAVGLESGNAAFCLERHLPWLQDTAAENVWTSWGIKWRDVVVLDAENRVQQVYNLAIHDLRDPANYDALKAILVTAASAPPR